MRAYPSIAFNSLSGTSKSVTARSTKNGTALSSRAQHSRIATPAQKMERAILSKVGRRYKSSLNLRSGSGKPSQPTSITREQTNTSLLPAIPSYVTPSVAFDEMSVS